MSAKLGEALRDNFRRREVRLRTFVHERQNGCGQGCPKRPRLDRANVGLLESSKGLSRKVVVTTSLHRGEPVAQACKAATDWLLAAVRGQPWTPTSNNSASSLET